MSCFWSWRWFGRMGTRGLADAGVRDPRPQNALSRRVLVFAFNYPPEPTGISPYTGAMAAGLGARDFDVHVLATYPHYPTWRLFPGYGGWSSREDIDGVNVRRKRHYVPRVPSSLRRAISEISFGLRLAVANWNRPDVIVSVSPALLSTAIAVARVRLFHHSTPLVLWVQDLYSVGLEETGQNSGHMARFMKHLEAWVLRHVDRLVVIHDRFAERVVRDFHIPRERLVTIRNWTHLPPALKVGELASRAEFGWPEGTTIVLHAGNVGVKQGLENVVSAARHADEVQSDVRFVLLGTGGEARHLKAISNGVDRIQFMDPLPDDQFMRALSAADILLVNEKPGVSEMAVPSKLTSYFNAGRPVVAATDVSGITAEEILTAQAGVVVQSGRSRALLDAVLKLRDQPKEMKRLGENGLHYRRKVLDEQHAIDRFAEVLDSLISRETNALPDDADTEWSTS